MFRPHFSVPLGSLTTLDNSWLSNSSPPSLCVAERAPAHHPKPRPESHIRKLKQRDQRVRSLFLLFAKKPARSCQKTWGPVNSNTQKDKNQLQSDPRARVCGESHGLRRCHQLRLMWPIGRPHVGWWHRRSANVKSLPLPGARHQAECPALTSHRSKIYKRIRSNRSNRDI